MRSLTRFSLENINFHSGMRVDNPVLFFTLSHNERGGEEGEEGDKEEDSLDGSIKATSLESSEASEDLLLLLLLIC